MNVDFKDGLLLFSGQRFFHTACGKLRVETEDNKICSEKVCWTKKGSRFLGVSHGLEITVACTADFFRIQVKTREEPPVVLKCIRIVFPPEDIRPPLETLNNLQLIHSRSFSTRSGVQPVGRKTFWSTGTEPSYMFTVFCHKKNGTSLLLGTLGGGNGFTSIEVIHSSPTHDETFGFSINSEIEAKLKPGAEFSTGRMVCLSGSDGLSLLEKYGNLWKETIPRKIHPPVTGWNSWDYYAGAVRRKDIDENLTAIKKTLGSEIKYIIIDEGWECQWGIWQANWKFLEGMENFCDSVRSAGYLPGIWTAPFLVNCYSPLYREHPEFFAADHNGQLVIVPLGYGPMAVLDVTRDKVMEHLEKIYRGLKKCGFTYFKIDFLELLLRAFQFSDRSVGRAELVRKGISAIRRAIGTDSYLLACGPPFESVTGLADAVRVTGDIHNFWGHVKANVQAYACRYWMNGKLWHNDPDFLIVRSPETTDDPWLNRRLVQVPFDEVEYWCAGRDMNLTEVKTYALFIFLSGGDVILGDAIPKLNAKGLVVLKRILKEPLTGAAVPLDLFNTEGHIPSTFVARERKKTFVGVFNWSDHVKEFNFSLKKLNMKGQNVRDFWTDKSIPAKELEKFSLPARSAAGLVIF